MEYKAFIGGSYESQAITADAEECINWYAEKLQSPGATSPAALYPTPGVISLSQYMSSSEVEAVTEAVRGNGRGHFYENGREFAVIGTSFVEVIGSTTITRHGTVALDDFPATISSNGDAGGQLFITSGGNGYSFDLTTEVFAAVASMDGKANFGAYLDGYFVALDSDDSTLYVSALLDGTSWTTGTDFARRSLGSDPWVSMRVVGRYIWLLGELTTEIWMDTGESFPFAPTADGFIQFGIAAPHSAAVMGEALVWLGATKSGRVGVFRSEGFNPQGISSYPVETAIATYNFVSDAFGESYSYEGHTFYVLSFDSAGVTWAWDETTNLWAKRGTFLQDRGEFTSWYPRHHAFAFDEHRMLDSHGIDVYVMKTALPTDAGGRMIRRVRRAPALVSEDKRIFYADLEIDLEAGLGLIHTTDNLSQSGLYGSYLAQGRNPHIILRASNDGGKTWIFERMAPAGREGEWRKRIRWNRLGSARRRVYELVVTDPIPWRICGAFMRVNEQSRAS